MAYPIYLIFLSLAPGLIWLFYFLRKDVHPESNKMILKIFLLGMMSAPIAAIIECLPVASGDSGKLNCVLLNLFSKIFSHPWDTFFYFLIGVALIEEFIKYFVVRMKVLKNQELDEPIDALLYMIISALGFATLENIFIFFSPDIFQYTAKETLALSVFRFGTATFLHALCSATIGFFMAMSFCQPKNKKLIFFSGFSIAVLLHALYNFSIMELEGILRIAIPIFILIILAIFISLAIKKLKKLKGICKIES
jgi:RsiW-degrading membrane proteinase PrsW (M82 family)